MSKKMQVGEMLVAAGFIDQQQLDECLEISLQTNQRVGAVAVEKKYISQEDLYRILENQHNVSYVDLYRISIPPDIIKHMSADMARRNKIAPVKVENNVLFIAMADPKDFRAINEVRTAAHMDVRPMLASPRSLDHYIERVYGNKSAQAAISEYSKNISLESAARQVLDISLAGDVGSAPIVQLVNVLLEQAISLGASDIHIEPTPTEVRIRMRVDGLLSVAMNAPIATLNAIITRVKIMADLNIAERRIPQDGRIQVRVLGRDIDIRVSIVATVHGEKAVLRLLDRSSFFKPKEELGFTEHNLELFDKLLATPHGLILVAGPTGSGKSTTLYTMLDGINDIRDNIITIEDPVEYILEGLNQMQVNPKAGIDFATGLRAILRQDPDVVLVGEIRDMETVEIAMRAAITGHLVLSSIHTNDAVSSILRLVDMGIPSYMVAASLVGIISQRLVRVICPECKFSYKPEASELEMTGIPPQEASGVIFYKGDGCVECEHLGYKGRIAVHEIIIFDKGFRQLVHDNASPAALQRYAVEHGMTTIKDATLELVKAGITSTVEMENIVYGT